jgi:hypothetical protein
MPHEADKCLQWLRGTDSSRAPPPTSAPHHRAAHGRHSMLMHFRYNPPWHVPRRRSRPCLHLAGQQALQEQGHPQNRQDELGAVRSRHERRGDHADHAGGTRGDAGQALADCAQGASGQVAVGRRRFGRSDVRQEGGQERTGDDEQEEVRVGLDPALHEIRSLFVLCLGARRLLGGVPRRCWWHEGACLTLRRRDTRGRTRARSTRE